MTAKTVALDEHFELVKIALLKGAQEAVRARKGLTSSRPRGQEDRESHQQLPTWLLAHLHGEVSGELSPQGIWVLRVRKVESFPRV